MAAAISATGFKGGLSSSFYGSWGKSIAGEDFPMLAKTVAMGGGHVRRKPIQSGPMMGNKNEGKGVFAPLVVVTRNIIGKKRFNQLRGKAIALHSQVKTKFLLFFYTQTCSNCTAIKLLISLMNDANEILQVITEFCKTIGADAKQRQGLIRLAKKNGEKLGFLA